MAGSAHTAIHAHPLIPRRARTKRLPLAGRSRLPGVRISTGEPCPTRFSLAEIPVLVGTPGAGGMAPTASTRILARLEYVHGPGTVDA